jgi:endonuclease YncB( thermonuclease family)
MDPPRRDRMFKYGWNDMLFLRILLFLFLLPLPAPAADSWRGRVVSVQDGDTLTVLHDGTPVRIRLYGVDCPERRQPFGNRARKAVVAAVAGREVNVHPVDRDDYGRIVAIVAAPGREMLHSRLVKSGLAWVYEYHCKHPELCLRLKTLESQARAAGIGLWQDKNPVPPWEWRRMHQSRGEDISRNLKTPLSELQCHATQAE